MLKDGYGYVYLLKEDGDNVMYKIGVTKSPKIEDRIKKLQTGNGNRIVLIDCFLTNKPFKLEKMLHTKYSTRNAPPPCSPASYGNRHILPSPTAEPTVAAITPIFVTNCALFPISFFLPLSFLVKTSL